MSSDAGDNDAYLLLADYDVNDKLGVAVRFSQNEQGANADYEKFTIAPNYAITDSLVLSSNIVMLTTTMLNPKSTPLSLPTLSKFYT